MLYYKRNMFLYNHIKKRKHNIHIKESGKERQVLKQKKNLYKGFTQSAYH